MPAVDQILVERHRSRVTELSEDWRDEVSEAALANNSARAGYLERFADRADEISHWLFVCRLAKEHGAQPPPYPAAPPPAIPPPPFPLAYPLP